MLARINEIIEKSGLTLLEFSNKIGVSKATLSHVLNQRNKPSLDFVLRLHNAYPENSLDWILTGQKNVQKEVEKEIVVQKELVYKKRNVKKIMIFYDDETFEEFHP